MDGGALDKDAMIRHIVSPNSTFLNEGKNNLIEEFGKDYGIYFSILSCIARGQFTRIGRWWDRRGENEIDMIAEDELSDSVTFYEIKRQADEISMGVLKQRAEVMLQATHEFKKYDIRHKGLSMEDM